jgi:hypothetical protein
MNEHIRPWLLRLTALLFLVVCGSVAVMVVRHRSSNPVLGPYSIPAASALVLAFAASAAALTVAVLPPRRLDRLADWLLDGLQPFRIAIPAGTRLDGVLLLSLAVASYAVIGFRFLQSNEAPRADQLDYLSKAAEIRDGGGLVELSRQLWRGSYEKNKVDAGNRHPLYTAALSIRPDFETAKNLSFVMGLVTMGIFSWATVRRFGWLVGGVAAVLLATNSVFQQSASIVACEMMLVLWTLLAWFAIERLLAVRQDSRPPSAETSAPGAGPVDNGKVAGGWIGAAWRRHRGLVCQCASVGGWLALAYLTKASAVFLLVGFLAWSLCVRGLRSWSWVAIISFAAISSPLLVRNARAFGDPLYSFNTRFLFADSFDQGLGRPFRGTWTEASDYLKTHSAGSIVHRGASGLAWEAFIFLRSLAPATLDKSRPLVGLVILMLAMLGTIHADRKTLALAAVWCAIFYLFFAWYVPIAAGDRFLAPIIPIVLLFAARGTTILIASRTPASPDRASQAVRYAAILWCLAVTVLSFKSQLIH